MSLLTAHNLAKEFGPDEIFSGVNVDVPHKARIALVGPNGAGKTTLLSILIGLDTPSEGTVNRVKKLKIGWLPQRPEIYGEHTIYAEMLAAFADLRQMEADLAALEQALADPTQHDAVLGRYGELQEQFEAAGGYSYEQRIKTVLHGLSFKPEDYERRIDHLSGGQKTRVLLGRLLLEQPDLLALDEPTNHLDIDAVEWLEGFLNEFPGAVIVVSHDRYFMDAVAQTIWELDFGSLESYRGNYSAYVTQRDERHERMLKEYEAQQEFIAKETEYIRRNLAGQNTKQAQGRRTRLERLKREGGLMTRPHRRQSMSLRLGGVARSGDRVLASKNLAVGYPDRTLFQSPDIFLRRGEVAALIGANGVGKSTFVKTVIGDLQPQHGAVIVGANVKIGYFAQAHELLNENNSILDEIQTVKAMPISEARNYLGQFSFRGDDVFRPINTLSGGERGRVALAKLALAGANFLLLDEPTNHLDIASQEILQNVLADFPGTILLVSHDRYLIDALATQIWTITPGQLDVFEGTYAEYLAAREKARLAAAAQAEAARAAAKPVVNGIKAGEKKFGLNPYQLQKRIEEVEAQILELEAKVEEIGTAIADASAGGDAGRVSKLGAEYTRAEADLQAAMEEWERLVS